MDPNLFTPERITLVSVLIGIIYAGARKWWVWGYQLEDAEKRRIADKQESDDRAARWEAIALKALNVGEHVVKAKE